MDVNKKVLIVEDQYVEAHDLELMLRKAGYSVCGIARSVMIAQDMIRKEKPDLVLLDIFLRGKLTGVDLARQLTKENIAFIYLSANSNEEVLAEAKTTEPYGFIVKPFREKDLLVTLEIANYRHQHSSESKYRREAGLISQLNSLGQSAIGWHERVLEIGKILQQELPFDCITTGFDDYRSGEDAACFVRIGFNEYQPIDIRALSTITGYAEHELASRLRQKNNYLRSSFFNDEAFEKESAQPSMTRLMHDHFDMQCALFFPIHISDERSMVLSFFSKRSGTYSTEHLALLKRLEEHIAHNTAFSRNTLANTPQRDETGTVPKQGFDGIIGNSHLLLNTLDHVTRVAPFDTSVLILGESGTGKERIATCIHQLSPRKNKPLVKVNCAALPPTLIESELFGHNKGAFTGANEKRIGKFEQANGGTIFLDEIGEMPMDLQVKLLRVLQEKEIEPIGSKTPVKTEVRVIAATNRNLEKEVAEGRFRLDLYYRLNVFPIEIPSLRDRAEDIPVLSNHFIQVYNRKSGKSITGLSENAAGDMMNYHWPGNIRELENLIERSVLLAKNNIIEEVLLPGRHPRTAPPNGNGYHIKTIHENERDHIIDVLKMCKGRVWGPGGAAEVLQLPPTTLKSKMKKLGITNYKPVDNS